MVTVSGIIVLRVALPSRAVTRQIMTLARTHLSLWHQAPVQLGSCTLCVAWSMHGIITHSATMARLACTRPRGTLLRTRYTMIATIENPRLCQEAPAVTLTVIMTTAMRILLLLMTMMMATVEIVLVCAIAPPRLPPSSPPLVLQLVGTCRPHPHRLHPLRALASILLNRIVSHRTAAPSAQ